MGEYCSLGRRADKLYKQLQPALAGQPCYKLETARCLSMCAIGPNLVIYPDDLVFNKLDETQLAAVIRDHLPPCEEI
jgi:(2Fe-2S) ferredoxin